MVDEMEDKGEVDALYRDFKINLDTARDFKVSFFLSLKTSSLERGDETLGNFSFFLGMKDT